MRVRTVGGRRSILGGRLGFGGFLSEMAVWCTVMLVVAAPSAGKCCKIVAEIEGEGESILIADSK